MLKEISPAKLSSGNALRIVAGTAILAVLYFAREILVPITLAAILSLLMMPLAWFLGIPMRMGIMGVSWAVVIASFLSCGLLLTRFWMLARRDV